MDNVAEAIREFVNNSLGVNLIEMVIQIASTIVLFLVVKFFFWNNITDYLEKRKETMNEEYDKAQLASSTASDLQVQAETELLEIRHSAKGLFEEAKERGELERKNIITKAKTDAERLVENAHIEIEQELEKVKTEINNEIVMVATLMAEKIIQKEIDPKKHKDLIKDVSRQVQSS